MLLGTTDLGNIRIFFFSKTILVFVTLALITCFAHIWNEIWATASTLGSVLWVWNFLSV